MRTLYIVPAATDQAGQCRIVARKGLIVKARQGYIETPDAWSEVGLMNSQGSLVCFEGSLTELQALRDCEPLTAGLQIAV